MTGAVTRALDVPGAVLRYDVRRASQPAGRSS